MYFFHNTFWGKHSTKSHQMKATVKQRAEPRSSRAPLLPSHFACHAVESKKTVTMMDMTERKHCACCDSVYWVSVIACLCHFNKNLKHFVLVQSDLKQIYRILYKLTDSESIVCKRYNAVHAVLLQCIFWGHLEDFTDELTSFTTPIWNWAAQAILQKLLIFSWNGLLGWRQNLHCRWIWMCTYFNPFPDLLAYRPTVWSVH